MYRVLVDLIVKRDTLQIDLIEIENQIFSFLRENNLRNYLIVNWEKLTADSLDEKITN